MDTGSPLTQVRKPAPGREHGSPYDRGTADAYYQRAPRPHKKIQGIRITQLSKDEHDEYMIGYDAETGRKDWGD